MLIHIRYNIKLKLFKLKGNDTSVDIVLNLLDLIKYIHKNISVFPLKQFKCLWITRYLVKLYKLYSALSSTQKLLTTDR